MLLKSSRTACKMCINFAQQWIRPLFPSPQTLNFFLMGEPGNLRVGTVMYVHFVGFVEYGDHGV